MAQIPGKNCKIRSKFCYLDNALSQIISNLLVKERWKLSVEKLTSQKLAYKFRMDHNELSRWVEIAASTAKIISKTVKTDPLR